MKEYRLQIKAKSLRPANDTVRDSGYLSEAINIYPESGVLRTHDAFISIVHSLDCSFPYPQIFCLAKLTVICVADTIYEYDGFNIVQKITSLPIGLPWSVADFHDFLLFTNGSTTVVRDGNSFEYSVDSLKYIGSCCINLNGQLIMGGIKDIKQP